MLGHMWIMLGTYVNIKLDNLLTTFYLKFDRSRMCLMLQRTRFQVQVLRSYKFVQESSEEVMDFKTWQLAQQLVSIEV